MLTEIGKATIGRLISPSLVRDVRYDDLMQQLLVRVFPHTDQLTSVSDRCSAMT
jgi:hypothetical protein